MKMNQGTIIAPTEAGFSPSAVAPDLHLGHATIFWPSPLRRGASDPVFRHLPRTLFGFVWRMSAWDQIWLAILSVAVSFLGTAPIEIQRRIVNEAIKQKNLDAIWTLALIYAGLVIAQGLLKLLLNMYRGWVGANSIRVLRTAISTRQTDQEADPASSQGVKISMIVAESDAIGGFVGDCLSEPALALGILLMVFGYMVYLQPVMAAVSLLIFAPQVVVVPVMQRAINRRVQARIATLRAAGADVIADQEEANVKALGHEGRFREVFKLDMGIVKLKFTLNFLMNISTHMGMVAIIGLGAWFVVTGNTQVGTVVAFMSGLSNVTDPWGDLVNWFQNLMVTTAKYDLVRDAVADLSAATQNLPASAEPDRSAA